MRQSERKRAIQLPVKVVLADDHPVLLVGVEQALQAFPDIKVVACVRQSTDLIHVLQNTRCDALVTDLAMPGGQYGDGLPLIVYLRRHFPTLPVVVLTMLENVALLKRLRELGVLGIVSKSDALSHVGLAVLYTTRGSEYLGPAVAASLDATRPGSDRNAAEAMLSTRELEVVRLLVSGMTPTGIAALLKRSIKTISTQKKAAMRKLGLAHDAQLFQYAQHNGLLNLSPHMHMSEIADDQASAP
ncbi:two component transcriptional regulator, LuxR family [Paraburkholderia megapolitana]|uniref:Two component transcriptional regulator, LuxR family n=1 Tax=Paraburkholderia megapolitana TaxID=420953 RepID=A0A1I3SPX2_9BURK|nr:two component transcriptional regulator, LuxR family [Paraburkholderia megapolitana]